MAQELIEKLCGSGVHTRTEYLFYSIVRYKSNHPACSIIQLRLVVIETNAVLDLL